MQGQGRSGLPLPDPLDDGIAAPPIWGTPGPRPLCYNPGMKSSLILLFNLPKDGMEPMVKILMDSAFSIHSAATVGELYRNLDAYDYQLAILGFPAPGFEPREFITVLRGRSCRNRGASLLLLVPEGQDQPYLTFLGKGANGILPANAPGDLLEAEIARLTQVAPRLQGKFLLRLKREQDRKQTMYLCQTQNLSRTGVFLATTMKLPVDTPVSFEFPLPDNRTVIRGDALVVRHAQRGRESDGMALQFTDFRGAGGEDLLRFLSALAPPAKPS